MQNIDLLSIDPENLFEKYTINEIIEIHKKILAEIDKKRQELRCMVGERYRDVITAADTIKCMQNHSGSLVSRIVQINNKCQDVQSTIDEEDTKSVPVDKSTMFYRSIAIQIKILILIPEYIWSFLDIKDYLKASQLYLLAIHMHTGLELDTEHQVSEHFALLSRLRLSINLFRNRIIDGLKKHLQCTKITPEEASNHLSAYMLLENQSLKDTLVILVDLRKDSLMALLKTNISQHNTVRSQIMSIMNFLVCTVQLIHTSFVGPGDSNGLIVTLLKKICLKDSESTMKLIDLEPTPLLEYLPVIVSEYRPTCDDHDDSVMKIVAKEIVQQWLHHTVKMLEMHLSKSLDLVTSVKTLHAIREESLKLELPCDWNEFCKDLNLPDNFNVWYYLFQPLVSTRAEKLICCKVEANLQNFCNKISTDLISMHTSEQSESDLRWYIWSESSQDLSKDTNSHAGLSMKARGYSERVVALCEDLNLKCLDLLQDINLYLYGSENIDAEGSADEHLKPEQQEERKKLELHLSKESSNGIDSIILYIENFLCDETNDNPRVTKTITAARFLQAIPQLCPYLMKCCSRDTQETWEIVSSKLTESSLKMWQYWLTVTIKHVEDLVKNNLVDGTNNHMLKYMPRWDIIEIEEQDGDKTVHSQIRIPLQPTVALMNLLFIINEELNAVLPHTIPKQVHLQFIENMINLILGHYEDLSKIEVNQNQALQLLLDVKFLTTICIRRDNKNLLTKSQEICDGLRSKVDPFDLDVFYPHLQANIKRCVLQSQALFGCFLPSHEQLASLGMFENSVSDKEPSILAVSSLSSDTWFSLLPVTTPIIKSLNLQPISSPTISAMGKQTSFSKPISEASNATSVRSGAAAFFGAMTNDWFT